MRYIHCWSSVKSLIQESRECAHLESSLGSNSMIHPSVLFIWVFRAASLECAGRGAMFNGSGNLRYSKKVVVASSSNPSTSNSHYFIHLQESEGADFGRELWTPTSFMPWFMPVVRRSTSKMGIVQVYCSFSGLLWAWKKLWLGCY